jgi:hypothetical protein
VIAIIEESAQYSDCSTYIIDKLPEEWEDMPEEDQVNWIVQNGKYQQTESVFVAGGELAGIEIEEEE